VSLAVALHLLSLLVLAVAAAALAIAREMARRAERARDDYCRSRDEAARLWTLIGQWQRQRQAEYAARAAALEMPPLFDGDKEKPS
jgi:hypothetical protein